MPLPPCPGHRPKVREHSERYVSPVFQLLVSCDNIAPWDTGHASEALQNITLRQNKQGPATPSLPPQHKILGPQKNIYLYFCIGGRE